MTRLRACYTIPVMDSELWKGNMARYFEELSRFPIPALNRAFEGAWRHHENHFPTLGQMHVACKIAMKETAHDSAALPLPRRDDSPAAVAARKRALAYVDQVMVGVPQKSSSEPGGAA